MNTPWYHTRAGREWKVLMQDLTGVFPGVENQRAEAFANSISLCTGIGSNVILGWIKNDKIPSIENLQKTIEVFSERMHYYPVTTVYIIEETRNYKKEIRNIPYVEDKIERLSKYLRANTSLLDKLVHEYCDSPIIITARITNFDEKSSKYHVHFYDLSKSNTAFMRERINHPSQIRNLLDNGNVRSQIANQLKTKNFIITYDNENSLKVF